MKKTKTNTRKKHATSAKKILKDKAKSSQSIAKPAKVTLKSKKATKSTIRPPKKTPAQPAVKRQAGSAETAAAELLTQARADITAAVETLKNQINNTLATVTELARPQGDQPNTVERTAPLDRATAIFQRLVTEVVDEQLAEMLGPLVALRNETSQIAAENHEVDGLNEFHRRAAEILDHVLALAGVQAFEACVGEAFDPLIHLAVGQTHREDLADGAVAEQFQPGFRSNRGKIIAPAKIRINRR